MTRLQDLKKRLMEDPEFRRSTHWRTRNTRWWGNWFEPARRQSSRKPRSRRGWAQRSRLLPGWRAAGFRRRSPLSDATPRLPVLG